MTGRPGFGERTWVGHEYVRMAVEPDDGSERVRGYLALHRALMCLMCCTNCGRKDLESKRCALPVHWEMMQGACSDRLPTWCGL
jgi:hypothetical protein